MVVGGENLSNGFESEANGEKNPDLTGVAGRAKTNVERTEGGERDDDSVERVGEEEAGEGGADKLQIADEEGYREESGEESEPRKLA